MVKTGSKVTVARDKRPKLLQKIKNPAILPCSFTQEYTILSHLCVSKQCCWCLQGWKKMPAIHVQYSQHCTGCVAAKTRLGRSQRVSWPILLIATLALTLSSVAWRHPVLFACQEWRVGPQLVRSGLDEGQFGFLVHGRTCQDKPFSEPVWGEVAVIWSSRTGLYILQT